MGNHHTYIHFSLAFTLLEQGSFKRSDIIKQGNLSRSTFARGVADLRCYLQEYRPYLELVYDHANQSYSLVDTRSEAIWE